MAPTYENLRIRRLHETELDGAYLVVHQLRTQLKIEEFRARVARQAALGYELIGAFEQRALVGVLGMRPVETLARGLHLHVDDLVVDKAVRRSGIGRALLEFAERDAVERGLSAVFLDSRREVIPFYERFGYSSHDAVLMRKRVA